MIETIRQFLGNPVVLGIWIAVVVACVLWTLRDLRQNNAHLPTLMRWVWVLTVAYSGPLGVAVYYFSGRAQIDHDSFLRRGFRSVAHCYSGCGAGEIAGLMIAVGLLALSTGWVVAITFSLAYVAGFAMTVGPLMQGGMDFKQAFNDALWAETASITVMEIVAIGTDLWLAGDATMGEPLFWMSLFVSLSCGLLAAYPVNLLLIHYGVKEGMHSPKMAHH
ncbi:DUF4396 domain-containing protein [Salinisphaera sp. P385]|uniref:DUF4396 domain-containing protein n=1 Tax=Spectribacter acetivorans TaxID=3075603 RepID=A0ABU3B4T9_9GAMM|nr:DUF4396 domain-containing protein [Salinisphaera sp. P385]MDT0617468.1 DUF4396 domain-containing protein [Salinisphaera sp. P385]